MYVEKDTIEFENNTVNSRIVKYMRRNFYKGWRKLLVTKITKEDANALQRLVIDVKGLKDLEFLKYFPNLTEVVLTGDGSSLRIAGVRYTPKVEYLSIYDIQIDDFMPLGLCSNLKMLDYVFMDATPKRTIDLSFLRNLPKLWELDLSGLGITDTAIFVDCKNLKELLLSDNPVSNLDGLAELTNLEWLELENCGLTSLEGIEKIPNLKRLFAENNKLSNEQKHMYRKKFSYMEEIEL